MIIDADFDGVKTQKALYAQAFGFNGSYISGSIDINAGSTNQYQNIGIFNGTRERPISGDFSIAGDVAGFNHYYSNGIYKITTPSSPFDKDFRITSIYVDYGSDDLTPNVATLDVHVHGGYTLSMTGSIVSELGETAITPPDQFVVNSSNAGDSSTYEREINLEEDTLVDEAFISSIESEKTFDFIEFRNESKSFKIPFDGMTAKRLILSAGHWTATLFNNAFANNAFRVDVPVNEEISNAYVIGIKLTPSTRKVNIIDVIPLFETSTGFRYRQRMGYFGASKIWLPLEAHRKAVKLIETRVVFTFTE